MSVKRYGAEMIDSRETEEINQQISGELRQKVDNLNSAHRNANAITKTCKRRHLSVAANLQVSDYSITSPILVPGIYR
jgi:ABC-type transporter Mla subunit MlaD